MSIRLRHLLFMVAALIGVAAMGAGLPNSSPADYDPENPPEPSPFMELTVVTDPATLAQPIKSSHMAGTSTYVTAASYVNYDFVGWVRDGNVVTTERTYYFDMPNIPLTLTAKYEYNPNQYNPDNPPEPNPFALLTIVTEPSELAATRTTSCMIGETATITATNYSDYDFIGWIRDNEVVSTERTYRFEMPNTPLTLTARYEYNPNAYNPENPGEPGPAKNEHYVTVTYNPSDISSSDSYRFAEGAEVSLTARLTSDYDFVNWTYDGEIVCEEREFTFIMPDKSFSLTANYLYNPNQAEEPGQSHPARSSMVSAGKMEGDAGDKINVPFTITSESYLNSLSFEFDVDSQLTVHSDEAYQGYGWTMTISQIEGKYKVEISGMENSFLQYGAEIYVPMTMSGNTFKGVVLPINVYNGIQQTTEGGTYTTQTGNGEITCVNGLQLESIEIEGGDRTVSLGDTAQLTALFTPTEVKDAYNIDWASSNTEIVDIDENGLLTPKVLGNAVITATVREVPTISATCIVTVVYAPSENVVVTPDSVSMKMTHNVTLTAQVDPNVAEQKVTWEILEGGSEVVSLTEISDLSVKVNGLKIGEATVRATAADGLSYSDVPVTVTTLVDSVRISEGDQRVYIRSTTPLTATIYPDEAASLFGVVWTSSNSDIAEVDENGTVSAKAIGQTVITATVNDGSGISHSANVTVVYAPSENVVVTPDSVSMKMTHEVTLTAQVDPDVAEPRVLWEILEGGSEIVSLSDMTDLSVKVKGLKLGSATVRATAADGLHYSDVPVTVTTLVDTVIISGGNRTVYLGSTTSLTAVITPNEAAALFGVTWSSSNPQVVSVDDNGAITAHAIGYAAITATVNDGSGISTSCHVTVVYAPSENVVVTPDSVSMKMTHNVTLTAQVDPDVAEPRVTWEILEGGSEIVSLSDATDLSVKVKGLKIGSATVRATAADGLHYSDVPVTVTTLVDTVIITGGNRTVYLGSTTSLTAVITPDEAADIFGVTWSSSNPQVVSVDDNGAITAHAIGNAAITATVNDGSGISTSCLVTVIYAPSNDVIVTPGEATIKVADAVELTAEVDPEFAEQRVTWAIQGNGAQYVSLSEASDLKVKVTGEAIGEAVIRATTADSLHTADVRVTVRTMIESLTITGSDREVILGSQNRLEAVITPSAAAARYGVTWSSNNPAVASVNESGVVSANAIGQATITATATDGSGITASIVVTVVYAPSDGVIAESNFVRIYVETSEVLNVTVSPEFAEQRVNWAIEEGSENVAISSTTDLSATVEGLELGTARIRATSADGNNYADIAIEVYTLEQSHTVSSSYDGRLLTLDCDTVADIYLSFDNREFEVKSEEMMTPETRRVFAYSLSRHKLPSDTVSIEIPCFYDGGEMYLHRENSMEKALEWCGGEVQTPTLTVIGRMGGEDFRMLRDQTGVIGIDLSETELTVAPSLGGMSWLKWASLPVVADGSGMFEGCSSLAAVVWNSTSKMPSGLLRGVDNPNLLLYVPEAAAAADGVNNVVVGSEGNYRAERITLSDEGETNPYYAPMAFTAGVISYTRRFAQETGYDQNTRGYESLMLPFDVETVTHPVNGACAPFDADRGNGEKPFWLYRMGDEMEAAASIEAYKPYLISMPNNDRHYFDDYILGGNITFAARESHVEATPELTVGSHRGTMEPIARFEGVYALNVGEIVDGHDEGSVWVNNYRGVRTFEAYIVMADGPNNVKIFDTTGIEEVTLDEGENFKAWAEGGVICVVASSDSDCGIYDVAGTLMARLSLTSGQVTRTNPLGRGVYIVRIGKEAVKLRL